jgi:hypothetical protein
MINPTEINTKLMTEVTSATTTSARDEAGEGSDSEQRGKLPSIYGTARCLDISICSLFGKSVGNGQGNRNLRVN